MPVVGPRFPYNRVSVKERLTCSRIFTKPREKGARAQAALSPGTRAQAGLPGSGARVPGGLLHLCPPAVVGVADEQQDLTPEQHEGRVGGDHGAHPRVQALQAVEATVRAVRQESRGSCSDSPECP